MIQRSVDEPDGIIFVEGSGKWSPVDVDEHYSQLNRLISLRRKAGLPIRILSDVTQAERQSPAVEALIKLRMEEVYAPGDRIALLVASEDDRRHVRAQVAGTEIAAFVSRLPAEIWLMMTAEPSRQRSAEPADRHNANMLPGTKLDARLSISSRTAIWGAMVALVGLATAALQLNGNYEWEALDLAAAVGILIITRGGVELAYRTLARGSAQLAAAALILIGGVLGWAEVTVGLAELTGLLVAE